MSDVNWTAVLQQLFGGAGLGTTIGLAVYLALRLAKSALTEAVKLAGQKEVEARKTELAKGLEDHKKGLQLDIEARKTELATQLESFKKVLTLEIEQTKAAAQRELAHELERERAAALREIERFKTELTFASETRRQAGALKAKALLDLLRAAYTFTREAASVPSDDEEKRMLLFRRLDECWDRAQEIQPLVNEATFQHINNLILQITSDATQDVKAGNFCLSSATISKLKAVIHLTRTELGIEIAQINPPKRDP